MKKKRTILCCLCLSFLLSGLTLLLYPSVNAWLDGVLS